MSKPLEHKRLQAGDWARKGVQLPPGWHERLAEYARALNYDRRGMLAYLITAAVDMFLSLPPDELRQRVEAIEREYRANYAGLVARHCPDPSIVAHLLPDQPQSARLVRDSGSA